MPPKNVALAHCKNHNVAGFSLEFERVEDNQDTKIKIAMASLAPVASMASMDWWRRVASITLVMMMVLRASLTLEAQSITNVNDLLLLRSWASTKIGEFLKRDAQKPTVPRVTDGSRSPTLARHRATAGVAVPSRDSFTPRRVRVHLSP